jgi:hypothetical protein
MLSLLLSQASLLCLILWPQMIRRRRGNGSPIEIETIVVNGLGAATGNGLPTTCPLLCGLWLLLDVRISSLVVACEIVRGYLSAKVAVQALVANVELSSHVVGHPSLEGFE